MLINEVGVVDKAANTANGSKAARKSAQTQADGPEPADHATISRVCILHQPDLKITACHKVALHVHHRQLASPRDKPGRRARRVGHLPRQRLAPSARSSRQRISAAACASESRRLPVPSCPKTGGPSFAGQSAIVNRTTLLPLHRRPSTPTEMFCQS